MMLITNIFRPVRDKKNRPDTAQRVAAWLGQRVIVIKQAPMFVEVFNLPCWCRKHVQ